MAHGLVRVADGDDLAACEKGVDHLLGDRGQGRGQGGREARPHRERRELFSSGASTHGAQYGRPIHEAPFMELATPQ